MKRTIAHVMTFFNILITSQSRNGEPWLAFGPSIAQGNLGANNVEQNITLGDQRRRARHPAPIDTENSCRSRAPVRHAATTNGDEIVSFGNSCSMMPTLGIRPRRSSHADDGNLTRFLPGAACNRGAPLAR
jgi:hypothetical protein